MMASYTTKLKSFFLSFSIILLCSAVAVAQSADSQEPDFNAFQQQLKKDYFSVGALLQTIGDYQHERSAGYNGFLVGNARLQVYGEFDQGFGYQLQTNFTSSAALLDAAAYYRFSDGFQVKTGVFKSPFSYEYLTGAAAIDFVNRSTAVSQLAPKRQIGVQLSGQTTDGILHYSVGAFNGNGFGINRNNDSHLLYVGRLEARFDTDRQHSDDQITFGVNASRETKRRSGFIGGIRGDQTLLGTDVRITQSNLFLAGEFIYSWLDADSQADQYNPFGYHATAGYHVTPKTQLLARWDYFTSDELPGSVNTESILAGINIFPTSVSEIQLNYIIPTEQSIEYSQVLVNFQISI
ncbi:porin [Halalkalibaculum sp. DA384]|uniref:porin n=1 Tax=Halalkalibaculum sp. DA384 TaxID=3373606 RepID=UPI0037540007